jgi:hypothetical protein
LKNLDGTTPVQTSALEEQADAQSIASLLASDTEADDANVPVS